MEVVKGERDYFVDVVVGMKVGWIIATQLTSFQRSTNVLLTEKITF